VEAYILRRQAALERLLARISKTSPGRWAVKGGLALEVRLGEHARSSLDLDADHIQGAEAAREDIRRAAAEDLGDNFAFHDYRQGGTAGRWAGSRREIPN
jgi:predicted nucleotidyltransferase component of viral defense system